MCSNSLEFRIPPDARYLSLVRRGLRSLAESAGFAKEDVADVEVAVSEAVANSMEHGCPDPNEAAVVVKVQTSGDYLIVEVEDQSDANAIPEAPPDLDATQERGRGLLMMKTLMDEYRDCRTEHGIRVRMAKQMARR
jgi:serine/threonine-protein kinase RsbW